jgi:DNA-directed RNA polymerase specialized sigma subunit
VLAYATIRDDKKGEDMSLQKEIMNQDKEASGNLTVLLRAAREAIEPRLVRVVEARFFAGLTEIETAEALGVSDRTVRRDWEKAKLMIASIMKQA